MFATKAKQFKILSYREHKPSGQGVVTLTDSVTHKRKEYWLGEFQSRASVDRYNRAIALWIAKGRRNPSLAELPKPEINRVTISEVIIDYKQFVDETYKLPTRATIARSPRCMP